MALPKLTQAAFRQQQQMIVALAVAVYLVHLWLDLFPLPCLTHKGGVDFIVKVADIADNTTAFQGAENIFTADIVVASTGHQHVGIGE